MTTDTASSPYPRDNFWGETTQSDDEPTGHEECEQTNPADYLAFQHLSQFVKPVCARTGVELSEPEFYLPKQRETEHGYEEYRQHRHRRRVNEETGYINWGESTATDLPEVGYETYKLAVGSYLLDRGILVTRLDEFEALAERFWHDPQYNSHGALEQFIRVMRDDDK